MLICSTVRKAIMLTNMYYNKWVYDKDEGIYVIYKRWIVQQTQEIIGHGTYKGTYWFDTRPHPLLLWNIHSLV